jgi:hypothetical protein
MVDVLCSQSVAAVMFQECEHCHATAQRSLAVVFDVYSELPAPAFHAASHCRSSHPFPDNAQQLVRTSPRTT